MPAAAPADDAAAHQVHAAQGQENAAEQQGAAAARQGQGQGQHGGGGQVAPVPQAQVKGHGQGRQQHGGGKVAVGQVQHAADVSLSQPGLAIGQQHRQGHAQAQGAENLRKPAVQVIGPLFRQVGAEQHIQHQHPHAQAQGIVQGQRLHGLLAGDHVAAPQQSGDGHQRQAQAAAADPQSHRPDSEVPQKGHQQRRHQRRAGQEIRQLPIALGGHEKGHEKRANRGQQVRAGGQQPDDDAPQGRHAIDRLTGGHERRRHGQKNREIGPAHPKALGSPAEPGKKCIQSPAHPGPQACRQIKRRHPHSTLRSFTAETTFLDTWKIFFHHPGPAHPFLSGAGPKNLTLGTLYHKKFEGFVNFWAHSLQAAAWYPSIVYFITFRAVCQVVNSTFSSE